jgi:hypothetical protein
MQKRREIVIYMVSKNKPFKKNKHKFASASMILIIVAVLLAMTMSGCLGPDDHSDEDSGLSGSQGNSSDNEESDQESEENSENTDSNNNSANTPANTGSSSFPDVVVASGSSGGGKGSSAPWLASVPNPFIGTWVSDADDNGVSLTFIGSSDGTFEYEMENLPAPMASIIAATGNGAYIVTKDIDNTNVIVSYFASGIGAGSDMIQSSEFVVKTNDLIEVTEFTLSALGQKEYGETTAFRREGTASRDDYVPTEFSNIFSMMEFGWGTDLPIDAGITVPSVWKFYDDGLVDCTFIGVGAMLGLDTKDFTGSFSYAVYDDDTNPYDGMMILYTAEEGEGNELFV